MKWFGVSILVLLGLIAAILGGYAIRYYSAAPRGAIEASETIQSGQFRIQAYTHFYDLKAAIDSYRTALTALDEQLKQVTTEGERERILATIAGLRAQRARAIAQYNADARKDFTIGQFRDLGLPYQIGE